MAVSAIAPFWSVVMIRTLVRVPAPFHLPSNGDLRTDARKDRLQPGHRTRARGRGEARAARLVDRLLERPRALDLCAPRRRDHRARAVAGGRLRRGRRRPLTALRRRLRPRRTGRRPRAPRAGSTPAPPE